MSQRRESGCFESTEGKFPLPNRRSSKNRRVIAGRPKWLVAGVLALSLLGLMPGVLAQSGQEKRIYVFAVGANGYGWNSSSLLHGSHNGNVVHYDTSGNGYVTADVNGNFSISGLYADRCASAPTPTTYMQAVSVPPPAATISKTYQLSFANGTYTGTVTFNGVQDPYVPTGYDITSVTGSINGAPLSLAPVPSGANSQTWVQDPVYGLPIDNVLYPNGYPSTGGLFDEDGIMFTDGSSEYNFFSSGDTFSITRYYVPSQNTGGTTYVSLTPGAQTGGIASSPSVQISLIPVACSDMPNLSFLTINEATTVVGAYALSKYANVANQSFSTNPFMDIQGPGNAAIAANDLVNGSTGTIQTTLPNGDPIPVAKINALAAMVHACITSTDGSACSSLFAAATPAGGPAPTTTLQAMLDIALNPTYNVNPIYNVLPSPQSYLSPAPSDWTLPAKLRSSTTLVSGGASITAGDTVYITVHSDQPEGVPYVGYPYVSCTVNGLPWGTPLGIDSGGYTAFAASNLPVGVDNLVCSFLGGTSRASSDSNAVVYTVTSPVSGMSLSCTPTSVLAGRTASCAATLAAGATGAVSFTVDGDTWQSVMPNGSGIATALDGLGLAAPGTHSVTASYAGDTTHPAAMQQAMVTVSANSAANALPVYSYSITKSDNSTGYAPNGNIMAYTDSINGQWTLGYDSLNRLTGSTQALTGVPTQYGCWSYDSFGNMQQQYTSNAAFTSASGQACQPASGAVTAQTMMNFGDASNRVTLGAWRDSTGNFTPLAAPGYDDAGNMTNDLHNIYLYDPDGHVCAMQSPQGGITGYLYDAEGHRVAKGTRTDFSCDPSPDPSSDPNAPRFTVTRMYVIGPDGQEMTEVNGAGKWVHTNVSAGGQMIATYENDGKGVHFQLADWLGTRRVQTTYAGEPEDLCQSQPFGDAQTCSHPELDASDHHFTGKERDAESGLDYFGARYYASNMGRWMSPDWATKAEPVPYSKLDDPQTLNLYQYVSNNPLSRADADGHDFWDKLVNAVHGNGFHDTPKPPDPPPPATPDDAKRVPTLGNQNIVKEQNRQFDACRVDGTKDAIKDNAKDALKEVGKSVLSHSEKEPSAGPVAGGDKFSHDIMDAEVKCTLENPLAHLDPNFSGVFKMDSVLNVINFELQAPHLKIKDLENKK